MTFLDEFIENFAEASDMDTPKQQLVFKMILLEFATMVMADPELQKQILSEYIKVEKQLSI